MLPNRIRSETELCRLNFSTAWRQPNGTYSPAVSRFTHSELASGLPFFTENEPVRFTRNPGKRTGLKGQAEVYALNWLARYNRMLEGGIFDAHAAHSTQRQ